MSHIVTIATEVKDPVAIQAACRRLQLPEPVEGAVRMYDGTATGWAVQLPDWRFPVVCDLPAGKLRYDNFEGRWGDPAELDRFVQAYTCEKARLEARRQGHTVREQQLSDGSIRLTVTVGGAA